MVDAKDMTCPHVLLLVSERTLHSLSAMLAGTSFQTEVSASGAEARVTGDEGRPDLVLLELVDGLGLTTLRQLRAKRPELPIVVLSAANNTRELVEAIRLGAQDYLDIPLNEHDVRRILQRYSGDSGASGATEDEIKQAQNLKALVRNRKFATEIEEISKALAATNWNRTAAARRLNISYRGLLYKIRQHGIARLQSGEPTTTLSDGNVN